MGLIQQIRDARERNRRQRASEVTQEFRNALFTSPLCSDYENVFAQVRPLIDAMVAVRPYGVGRNGAKLDSSRTPELNVLMDPNETMGAIEFMDTMFATWLTERALYIHVHKKGNSIKGYTLLPPDSKVNLGNGEYYWQVYTAGGTMERFYKDEVMELHYSRNPRDLRGVSPAGAVRIYAQIDDLLAQFEKAYLENGAIPASVTIIRASTQAKFNETRSDLERQLKGASNRNKTLYLWRQFNNDDGSERDQVEVKTIQGNNNTLAIKELATIISDRLNKAYGVSNFILGDDSSAKYDNAELSDYQFTRRRVKPALIKFWAQFQHELDRITGGLGYAIDFHLDMPELTERRKVEAETAEKTTQNLIRLLEAGARPSEACKSLNLPIDKWLNTAVGIYTRVLANRQAQLALASAESAPKTKTSGQSSLNSQDNHTSHTCQHHHEHTEDYYQPFSDDEKVEKKIFDKLMAIALAIFEEDPTLDLEQIQDEIYELIEGEANRGGQEALEMIAQLVDEETEQGIREIIATGGANISEELGRRLHERSNQIVAGYADHARTVMRSVLETSEPMTANQIKQKLMQVIPEGRAATIARNETVYAFKSGSLELDQRIAEKYNLNIELTWHARKDSQTCDTCAAMDGQTTMLGEKYADQVRLALGTKLMNGRIVGEAPEGADEEEAKLYTGTDTFAWTQDQWNDNGTIPNAHVNCRCFYTARVITEAE